MMYVVTPPAASHMQDQASVIISISGSLNFANVNASLMLKWNGPSPSFSHHLHHFANVHATPHMHPIWGPYNRDVGVWLHQFLNMNDELHGTIPAVNIMCQNIHWSPLLPALSRPRHSSWISTHVLLLAWTLNHLHLHPHHTLLPLAHSRISMHKHLLMRTLDLSLYVCTCTPARLWPTDTDTQLPAISFPTQHCSHAHGIEGKNWFICWRKQRWKQGFAQQLPGLLDRIGGGLLGVGQLHALTLTDEQAHLNKLYIDGRLLHRTAYLLYPSVYGP